MADNTKLAKPAELAPWELELAKEARDETAKESTGADRITHKSGVIKLDGKPVADNKLPMAIIDYGMAKAYYADDYEEGVAATPACYAFGRDEADMKPHELSPDKQASTCAECPHNKFGTAERGRGKRCKDERRVMAFVGTSDLDSLQKAEMRMLAIPPGSLKNWAKYLRTVRDVTPTGNVRTVITELGTEPLKGAYALTFKATEKLDGAFVQGLLSRRATAEEQMFAPYPTIDVEERPRKKRNSKIE